MSILIKGMEMPTEDEISKCIIVRHDGEVSIVDFDPLVNECGYAACYPSNPMKAVPIPPHGKLKDADALIAELNGTHLYSDNARRVIYRKIEEQPTIIPAEEET